MKEVADPVNHVVPPLTVYCHDTASVGILDIWTVYPRLSEEVETGKVTARPVGAVRSITRVVVFFTVTLIFPAASWQFTCIASIVYEPSDKVKLETPDALVIVVQLALPSVEYCQDTASAGREEIVIP